MTSPRTGSRLTRILAMLPWVIAHPGTTVDEVCGRFGYTRQDLLADLDLVFVCGLPGYGPGDLMVAYVENDEVVVDTAPYFANAPRLAPPEALALLAAGLTLLASGQPSAALSTAVEKLSAVLMPEGEEVLAVEIGAEPDMAALLREAAGRGEVVSITYTSLSSDQTSTREIEPWSVFTSLGNWYVSAFCRSAGAERLFRLDRIRSAERTSKTFTPPAEPPPPEVRYTPSEDDVRATILLDDAARWVADYYPVKVLSDGSEGLRIEFSASDPLVAARLVLRLGGSATLENGDEVRAELSRIRSAVLARYRHTGR